MRHNKSGARKWKLTILTVKWTVLTIAISLVSAITANAQQTVEITEKNWQQHPKIVAIGKIVSLTNARLKKGSLRIAKRELECGYEPNGTREGDRSMLKRIARDSKRHVIWYYYSEGGGDSVNQWGYYYDLDGRLRFIHFTRGAVSGSHWDVQYYFDESGTLIWHHGESPGWVDDDELKGKVKMDPAKDFAVTSEGCKEPTRLRSKP
jgi:hypothetical protein